MLNRVGGARFALTPVGQLKSASAGDDRCISVPGCPPPAAWAAAAVAAPWRSAVGLAAGAGGIALAACDGSPTQQWNLTGDPSVVTDVQSLAGRGGKPGSCWEINGCGGASIDTDYGCKSLPKGPRPWKGCNNMAWTFLKNGSIISGMQVGSALPLTSELCTTASIHFIPGSLGESVPVFS